MVAEKNLRQVTTEHPVELTSASLKMQPKVSVIIPNYNHARFLARRFESVLNQTFTDFEIIYLDDASTDHSNEVANKYLNDKCAKVILNIENSGSTFKQWNKGVREASGQYIWFAESDDYADEHLLKELVKILDEDEQVGLAYCQSLAVDEQDRFLYSMNVHTSDLDKERWNTNFINDGKDECRRFLFVKNTIPNASAVLFRKSLYESVGGADESYKINGDWLLWAKMLMRSQVAFIANHHNFYRYHNQTVRHNTQRAMRTIEEEYLVRGYIMNNLSVPSVTSEQVYDYLMRKWQIHVSSQILQKDFDYKRNNSLYHTSAQADAKLKRRAVKIAITLANNKARSLVKRGLTRVTNLFDRKHAAV